MLCMHEVEKATFLILFWETKVSTQKKNKPTPVVNFGDQLVIWKGAIDILRRLCQVSCPYVKYHKQ